MQLIENLTFQQHKCVSSVVLVTTEITLINYCLKYNTDSSPTAVFSRMPCHWAIKVDFVCFVLSSFFGGRGGGNKAASEDAN